MKAEKVGDFHQVRVPELLPCPRFTCRHELMSCRINTWCPDGCYTSNNYDVACIPCCMDCVHYPEHCDKWKEFPDKMNHRAQIMGVMNNLD